IQNQIDVSTNPIVRTALVEKIDAGSAAEKAGVKPGDLVIEADSIPVTCSLDLERGFLDKFGGDKVTVTVRRAGEEKRLELTLPSTERQVVVSASPGSMVDQVWKKFGVRV